MLAAIHEWILSMRKLTITGVIPRRASVRPYRVVPASIIEHFGRKPVRGAWSGLYGIDSKRDGLKELLRSARQSFSVFAVTCDVPGEPSPWVSEEDAKRNGYLNVRYADAALLDRVTRSWAKLAGLKDGAEAMYSHPELALKVAREVLGMDPSVVIHSFRTARSKLILTVVTVRDQSCITDVHARDPNVIVALGPNAGGRRKPGAQREPGTPSTPDTEARGTRSAASSVA